MITRARVNELLLSKYGKAIDRDLPKFRVVRAEEEVERRLGDFGILDVFGRPVATEACIRTVQKYPFLGPCWVLEIYDGVPDDTVRDAVQAAYTYEPLYVFLDKNEEPLELSWLPIEMVITFYFEAKEKGRKLTDAEIQELEAKSIKKEQEQVFEELGGKYSIADALLHKQGVAINDTTNLVEEKSNV